MPPFPTNNITDYIGYLTIGYITNIIIELARLNCRKGVFMSNKNNILIDKITELYLKNYDIEKENEKSLKDL